MSASSAFNAADRNHDGVIDRAEFNAAMGGVTYAAPPMMSGANYAMSPSVMTQSVGYAQPAQNITYAAPAQIIQGGSIGFDQLDRNHDGVITRDEFMQTQGTYAMQQTINLPPVTTTVTAPPVYAMQQETMTYAAPTTVTAPANYQLPSTTVTAPGIVLQERTVEVPQVQVIQKHVHVPGPVEIREVVKHVHKLITEEQIVEIPVPQMQTVEKIVEVPQVQIVHKQVHVPGPVQIIENVRHVPKIITEEQIVEIPVPQMQHVEKIVEIPNVQVVQKQVHVPGPVQVVEQVRHVHVPQVQEQIVEVQVPQVQMQAPPVVVQAPPVYAAQQVQTMTYAAPTQTIQGSVTYAQPATLFDQIDRNHDGVITRKEFMQAQGQPVYAAQQTMTYGAPQTVTYAAPAQTTVTSYGAPAMAIQGGSVIQSGSVSYAQPSLFDQIDRNHDGVITRDEFLQIQG